MNSARKVATVGLLILVSCERASTNRGSTAVIPADTTAPAGADTPRAVSSSTTPLDSAAVPDSIMGDADDYVPPISDSTAFSCSPKLLGPADTLTFRMQKPHGGELSIRAPENVSFSVVAPPSDSSATRFAVVSSEQFKTMDVLKVAADLRLPPRVYGKDTIPEPVFSHPGEYTMYMGDRLASDYTVPFFCTISFNPATR